MLSEGRMWSWGRAQPGQGWSGWSSVVPHGHLPSLPQCPSPSALMTHLFPLASQGARHPLYAAGQPFNMLIKCSCRSRVLGFGISTNHYCQCPGPEALLGKLAWYKEKNLGCESGYRPQVLTDPRDRAREKVEGSYELWENHFSPPYPIPILLLGWGPHSLSLQEVLLIMFIKSSPLDSSSTGCFVLNSREHPSLLGNGHGQEVIPIC